MTIKIIKGNVENFVREEDYEKIYKPQGWQKVLNNEKAENNDVKQIKTESELKNYLKMVAVKPLKFNDKLFYSEENGV